MGFVLEDLAAQQVRYPLVWDPSFGPCPWSPEAAPEAIPALYLAPFAWTGQMEREFWDGRMQEWADTHMPQLVVDWDFAPTRAEIGARPEVAAVWIKLVISFHVFTLPLGARSIHSPPVRFEYSLAAALGAMVSVM